MKTLAAKREEVERGLTPLCIQDRLATDGNVLVVLSSVRHFGVNGPHQLPTDTSQRVLYHCHRYFLTGKTWQCSLDGQNVPLEAVWSWLMDPSARSTQPTSYNTVEGAAKGIR